MDPVASLFWEYYGGLGAGKIRNLSGIARELRNRWRSLSRVKCVANVQVVFIDIIPCERAWSYISISSGYPVRITTGKGLGRRGMLSHSHIRTRGVEMQARVTGVCSNSRTNFNPQTQVLISFKDTRYPSSVLRQWSPNIAKMEQLTQECGREFEGIECENVYLTLRNIRIDQPNERYRI